MIDISIDDILMESQDSEIVTEVSLQKIGTGISNIADLWKQWSSHAKDFVKHKWIYRYINEKQKALLEKHYDVLKDENTSYSSYKKSFAFICKFMGLPVEPIIIENIAFRKDKKDKDQDIVALKYSKGKVRVEIPEGVQLIHIHTTADDTKIDKLIPSFRSKTVGKYMYPSRRCFFTCIKTINTNQCGLEGQKTYKLTPKTHIRYAYIDPTYAEFRSNSVYVETDTPIPVKPFRR